MISFRLQHIIAVLLILAFSCNHFDCHEVFITWNIYIINNSNQSIAASILNDKNDTLSIRNAVHPSEYSKYPLIFNTEVKRLDSEELKDLKIRPQNQDMFLLSYHVSNIYEKPKVEGINQFLEKIIVKYDNLLKDSIDIGLYNFPDDSSKVIYEGPYSVDPTSKWDKANCSFTDTIYIYNDSVSGSSRYLKWQLVALSKMISRINAREKSAP